MRIVTADCVFPEDVFKQLATIGKEFLIQNIPIGTAERRASNFHGPELAGFHSSQELIVVYDY